MQNHSVKFKIVEAPSGEVSTLVFYWPAAVGVDCTMNLFNNPLGILIVLA
ncbi:unnamed protein product, partial [marine sediment metagenome]